MSGSVEHSLPDDADDAPEYRQHRFSLPQGACAVLLVRHGESQPYRVGHEFPTVDGHSDPPLSPDGEQQARLVAERLAREDLAAIYVTSLRRTSQTAAPLARRTGLRPRVEAGLREVHLGEWEGGAFRRHVVERHPTARRVFETQRWDAIPGAESTEALTERVRSAVTRIAAAHPDEMVVVCTHGGVIGAIASLATGSEPFAFVGADNGSLTHLVVLAEGEDGRRRWIVRRFNDTGHLPTDLDRPAEPLV